MQDQLAIIAALGGSIAACGFIMWFSLWVERRRQARMMAGSAALRADIRAFAAELDECERRAA